MRVRSRHMSERQDTAKESAITNRATLKRQRGQIERWTAYVGLLISFLGTIATLGGGWPALLASLAAWHIPIAAIVGGLAVQGGLTFLEWYYFDAPLVAWPARIADAVLTALGYGPLFVGALAAALAARGMSEPIYGAWAIIGLVSYGLAWYPESRLVD